MIHVSNTVDEKYVEFCSNLPSGSGINGNWVVKETKNKIHFKNSYHHMYENGMYADWQDFSIVIDKTAWKNGKYSEFDLQFNNGECYLTRVSDLRSYLEDTFYYELEMLEENK